MSLTEKGKIIEDLTKRNDELETYLNQVVSQLAYLSVEAEGDTLKVLRNLLDESRKLLR